MNLHCQICQINTSKYSCPKCIKFYCSVECYQSKAHSECSEAFYESCVKEEMKNKKFSPDSIRKMMEILRENIKSDSEESLDSDDCESEMDLACRVESLNLDDADIIWDKLTFSEKKEFRKLISSGDIIEMIPYSEPWWVEEKQKMLIQDNEKEEFSCQKICPPIHIKIPDLLALTRVPPSPYIPHMLLNILGAYICCLRWFKGTHLEMPVESISTCIALSAVLEKNDVLKSTQEAFLSLKINYLRCKWLKGGLFDEELIYQDLMTIAQHKGDQFLKLKAALCDLDLMASEAIKILQNKKLIHIKRFTGDMPNAKQLILIKKKILYYLSWIVKYGNLLVNAMKDYQGIIKTSEKLLERSVLNFPKY